MKSKRAEPHCCNDGNQREYSAIALSGTPPQVKGGNRGDKESKIAERVDRFGPKRRAHPLAVKINRHRLHFMQRARTEIRARPERDSGLLLPCYAGLVDDVVPFFDIRREAIQQLRR